MTLPWWRSYFGEDFFRLHVDLFPEADSRREVRGMLDLLGLPAGARLLDVPCGWGRHTALLQQAGFDVVGADLSEPLLRHAARANPADPVYAAADIRALPFPDATFDGALNVFTSLGLFLSDEEDVRALVEIRRVLKPGGVFLLESMHRDDVIRDYSERDAWTLPDGTEVRARRRFDPVTGVSHEQLKWRRGDDAGQKSHALKLRTATEIDALLSAAGFVDAHYYGDWNGRPLRYDSHHLIALCRA